MHRIALMLLWACGGASPAPSVDAPPVACAQLDGPACASAGLTATENDARDATGWAMLRDACVRLSDPTACSAIARQELRAAAPDRPLKEGGSLPARAARLLERACELGDAEACLLRGRQHLRAVGMPRSPTSVFAWTARACEQRLAEGCVDEGIMHELGRGTGVDLHAARERQRTACELGDGRGCTKLGGLLMDGKGGAAEPVAGVELMERGCELGFAPGCGLAAIAFEGAGGVAADPERRRRLLLAGAGLGDVVAIVALERLGSSWTSRARRTELESLSVTCDLGSLEACAALGILGDPDDERVARARRRACEGGQKHACGVVGMHDGPAVTDPLGGRVVQLAIGCTAGHPASCVEMGRAYEAGDETDGVHLSKARRAYAKACELGHTPACALASRGELSQP